MKTLVTAHRKAVNKAAHAAAVRFEIETRGRWINDLTGALEAGASFVELKRLIAQLTPSDGKHRDSVVCVAK